MTDLLLGDEAVAQAALDAGIRGAFSYPGTPATEIFEYIQRTAGDDGTVAARWSANEKVAFEEALGMSLVGYRALVSMKHVGLNVAADPYMSSALTGVNGALVLAVCDDPGMHSSQNEQDTRFYGDFASVPLLEPANQQEAYDMTREAFELSDELSLPVVIRLVTRLAHSRSNVRRSPVVAQGVRSAKSVDWHDWTLLPVNARRRFRRLLDLQPLLRDWSERSPHNQLTLRGPRGVIATGVGYNYVREVLGDDSACSLLRISTYPAPANLVRRLVNHCDDVLIVEEGHPYVETLLLGLLGVPGKTIRGKRSGALSMDGELTADRVARALGMPHRVTTAAMADLPGRPPALCSGCPHCDTVAAVLDAMGRDRKPMVFSDIGCYTLAALPPYDAVSSCVDMGASISMALGAAKAGVHPVVCTIGDSTFTHSGMTPLLTAAAENANMTVVLLDNSAIAMTGGQDGLVSGEGFVPLLTGLGVKPDHIIFFEPVKKNHDQTVEMIRREIDHRGLSVIVASRPCIHLKRREKERTVAASA